MLLSYIGNGSHRESFLKKNQGKKVLSYTLDGNYDFCVGKTYDCCFSCFMLRDQHKMQGPSIWTLALWKTSTKLSFAVGFFHNTATWSTWYSQSGSATTKEVHFLIFEKSIGTEGGLCQSCYTIDLLYRSPSLQLYFSEFAVGKT